MENSKFEIRNSESEIRIGIYHLNTVRTVVLPLSDLRNISD